MWEDDTIENDVDEVIDDTSSNAAYIMIYLLGNLILFSIVEILS